MTRVRIRGIYTTALTQRLSAAGYDIVQASEPIRERFDAAFPDEPADVRIESSRDRRGLELSGDPDAVEEILDELAELSIDTFHWESSIPAGAIFDGEVREADGGSGAVLDLGDGRRGYLNYDDADGYVDAGDGYRVRVRESTPPWAEDHPRLDTSLAVENGLCTLSRDRSGVSAALSGEAATELVGMTELLSASDEIPEGWGLRWQRGAADADLETLNAALESVIENATALEESLAETSEGESLGRRVAPAATAWLWLGREARFELDQHRRAVETTMVGHHRIKAADRSASTAVDFAESVAGDTRGWNEPDGETDDESFPFEAVADQFGPAVDDRLEIGHGKPDGRLVSLGYGDVTEREADGTLVLERSMRGGGSYDALEVPKESGDVAETKFREGRWWYPTTYRAADGTVKGTYVNICTPVELFPDRVRYVDLYIDVIRTPDGSVTVVDEDELETAREEGELTDDLAEKARTVAGAVERALSP